MRILVLCIHYPVASGRYVFEALQRMGHEVRSFGPFTGNHLWGMDVDPKYVWTPALPEDDWQPDLTIVMDSALIVRKTGEKQIVGVQGMEGTAEIPAAPLTVVYGVDNHVRDYKLIEADHYFLGHGHGARIGDPDVTWLPCGFDPIHFGPGNPWADREFDAALIGVMYDQRAALLYGLRSHINAIKIAYGTGAIYAEYAEAYQDSRISLVVSAAHDVAQRVWETAAMGCLVVMDDCPDCESLGLVDGQNCLIYRDQTEAIQKVRWAMEHPTAAAALAVAGQIWAQDGTWDKRCEQILTWAENNAQKKAQKAVKKNVNA